MAAMPKRRRMKAALLGRGRAEIGPWATPLDYVCAWIGGGGLMKDLAGSLEGELNEPVSRSITSTLAHSLEPDASARIAEARRIGATALVEEALEIADQVSECTSAGVAKAKLRVDTRTWLASRWDRGSYGDKNARVDVVIDMGQLHINAMRARALEWAQEREVQVLEVAPPETRQLRSSTTATAPSEGVHSQPD